MNFRNAKLKFVFLISLVIQSASFGVCLAQSVPMNPQKSTTSAEMIKLAKEKNAEAFKFAQEKGAQILPTPDGKSFYVSFLPAGAKAENTAFIFDLHGHDGYATQAFKIWYPFLVKHGYGFVALQWWFGEGESMQDYYTPMAIYPNFEKIFRSLGLKPGNAMLHGFSRGSANIYAVKALDHKTGNNFFSLTVANAGGAHMDYPPTHDVDTGRMGTNPFANTNWVLFCGEQDPDKTRSGCPAMQSTQKWIEKMGGKIDLFIDDKNSGHGGFHMNPQNTENAFSVFERIRK